MALIVIRLNHLKLKPEPSASPRASGREDLLEMYSDDIAELPGPNEVEVLEVGPSAFSV